MRSRVPAAEASPRTLQRHIQNISELRSSVGVGLQEEMRALPLEERQALLQEAALPVQIPTEHTLAMKATLSIS